jgi:Rps23 Pro-64 3,4-dihydroxylase Tpa1-like proline 4-hydroxylase
LIDVVSPAFLRFAEEHSRAFQEAQPFPHLVFDYFLRPEVAEQLLADFDVSEHGWTYLHHINEKKKQLTNRERMQSTTLQVIDGLQTPEFIRTLEVVTGLDRLIPDPELEGSGMHETGRGGYLNMHVDFISHAVRRSWRRQLNLLVYLNHDWQDEYGGHLEFWTRKMENCAVRIAPKFNRCVVFQTSKISYHGYPKPLLCPEGRKRRSLALYYYQDEGKPLQIASTRYEPRPEDGPFRRSLIRLDTGLLRIYAALKRYVGVSDRLVSWLLRRW